jgi:DNA-binding MarR family transcriptional regulator
MSLPHAVARPAPACDSSAAEIGPALARLFRVAGRAKAQVAARTANPGAISALAILAPLAEHGPRRATDLAAAVHSDISTVSRQVAHLVELGLVERRPDPADRRACRLSVTTAGMAAFREHQRTRDSFFDRVTAEWSADDRRTLAVLLDRLTADLSRVTDLPSGPSPDRHPNAHP